MTNIKSIYLHVPFCTNICNYCDFCKMYYNDKFFELYYLKLLEEIKKYKVYLNNTFKTIYIGGGSPSSIGINNLEKILKILDLKKEDDYEYTVELMPLDITEDLLKLLRRYGVNRVSIGVETVNKKYQKLFNREIEKEVLTSKINLTKKYFNNINLDLMYASKNQTIKELEDDINYILSFDIEHISTYSLILENNTYLKYSNYKEIDDSISSQMYFYIKQKLESIGYKHYELSNYAKNKVSKHNLVYWNNEEYLGLGLSASGYIGDIRYTNTRNLDKYPLNIENERLNKKDKMTYFMILGLRKIEGINIKEFEKLFNKNIYDVYDIKDLLSREYLILKNDNLFINPKYLYVSNSILEYFV